MLKFLSLTRIDFSIVLDVSMHDIGNRLELKKEGDETW